MKIDDVIQLLNNRLREFKLSRDYARMNGDLERMNTADTEVLALEDTLFKLNLLVDTSKSAAIRETTLVEAVTDGSVAVLSEYDITPYATDPLHEEKIMNILSAMGVMDTVEKIDSYITGKYAGSPVTGDMVMSAAEAYTVDARLMMAIMEQDSRFGTVGLAVRTLNPGNVGNTDSGATRTYDSWQEGVTAVAEWLNRHRISKITSEVPAGTATSTPTTSTSTPTTASSTEPIPIITSTTTTSTSTPTTSTSTPFTTFTPTTASSTEPLPIITSTTTTSTSTPSTATSTPLTIAPTTTSTTTTSTTTPVTATSTPVTATPTPTTASSTEPIPIITSTTTTASSTPLTTSTSTPTMASSTEPIPIITSTTTTSTTTPVTATSTPS